MSVRAAIYLVAALGLAGCTATMPAEPRTAVAMPTASAPGLAIDEGLAPCKPWDEWDKPARPTRILGNTWYVGTCGISAILIADPAGHVLIDSGTAKGGELILANIRKIGADPADIRYLLYSHEHFDHVGGHAVIARATGAQIIATARARAVFETGEVSAEDPQADAGHPAMAPVAVDRIIADGETLTLGDIAITAHTTPGHTPGALSWTWMACSSPEEPPVCRRLAYVDSLSPVSADSYRFSDHPEVVAAFRASFAKVAQLPCDELYTPHPSASGREAGNTGYGQCETYARALSQRLDKRLAEEAAGG